MANKFNYRSGQFLIRPVPVASGVQIEIGDLLKMSSGKATPMATSTDNLYFCGVAGARHSSIDASGTVDVYMPLPTTVFEFDLDASTAVVIFDDLAWSSDQTLTVNATDPIATAMESKLAATKVLCVLRLGANTNGVPLVADQS